MNTTKQRRRDANDKNFYKIKIFSENNKLIVQRYVINHYVKSSIKKLNIQIMLRCSRKVKIIEKYFTLYKFL